MATTTLLNQDANSAHLQDERILSIVEGISKLTIELEKLKSYAQELVLLQLQEKKGASQEQPKRSQSSSEDSPEKVELNYTLNKIEFDVTSDLQQAKASSNH